MPTDTMTTKRMSFHQQTLQQHSHHHQQHQRRPPDVEEALSSMLWTPYERASITDTSSEEDDDEQLQRQLKRSKSQYDYTSVPTTIPPLTPPPSLPSLSSLRQPPTQFALPSAQLTPTNVVAYITTATSETRAMAATSLTSTTNSYYAAEDLYDPCVTTPLVPFSNLMLNGDTTATTTTVTTTPNTHLENTAILAEYDGNEIDDSDDVSLNADDTFNDVFNNDNTLAATSSSMKMMSSYQQKNHISYSSSYGRLPGLTKWWSTSSATHTPTASNSVIESTSATAITPLPPPPPSSSSANPTDETNKQPPSYESLYKKHPLRPLRQRHRLNKHLNLFKPVLETLKANVTTITQGRFSSLTQTDHNRDTNTTLIQPADAVRERTTTTASPTTTTTTTVVNSVTIEDNCSTESTSNNLVHSFTDNFLHEHCLNVQHVADTNVDNEHIINNNNNNTTENINGETPLQQQTLIHLQQHAHEHIKNMSNAKSKQNQVKENKQNNNFIISQQLQEQRTKCEEHKVNETCKKEMNTIEFTTDQHNAMNQPKSSPLLQATTNFTTTTKNTASLFYDSSSAISLTRSFEADTSFTFGLAIEHDSFETDLQNETRKTTTTYSLTPNKCLAELERLYAEFRASESLREQNLRESQNQQIITSTAKMRLNVPAPTSESAGQMPTDVNEGKSVSETTRLNPSTSSVFLTTTNSVTAITNPCQRTPSLTIQVNQSGNNNNNHQANKKIGQHEKSESQMDLNQAIVNSTTNGVSVINCNYVNNVNNNNRNNNNSNNKSITNLSDNATNTNNHVVNTIPTNYSVNNMNMNNNNYCSPNHHTNLNSISKNIKDNFNSDIDNIPNTSSHSSMSQVLNVKDINNHEVAKNYQKHLKLNSSNTSNTQVQVIQVNEVATKTNNETASSSSTSTPSSSPQRTFTSTESQTDDVAAVQLRSPSTARQPIASTNSNNTLNNNRDQRRRERRERRHLQHTASLLVASTHSHHPHPHVHPLRHGHLDRHSMPAPPLPPILHPPHLHPGLAGSLQQAGHNVAMLRPMLPDILHNHFPPPYSALPSQSITSGSGNIPHHNGSPITFNHPHPHHQAPQTSTATILGPPPPPPSAGTTLLTSVISTVPIPGATSMVSDGRFTLPLPIIRRSPSERSGKGCCGQWFAGPPLRALIAVVALGGVACALGGAALGATGLAGPPSSHFTAALLMIGVGVVLVTVSGAAWRMTAPGGPPCLGLGSSVDLGRCGRRPCSRGGGAPQGLLYPEFQHRPPPPSYQASMQEYRLRLLLLDRDRQNGVVRGSSPPPTYRSHAGSLLRAPLTSTVRGTGAGNRCESSIGGSEYSFPPSYRSRNATPGTISSERSIETEPSGRLLANEDIPEPLSVEQLSEYNSLQQRCNNPTNANGDKSEQKRNSIQLDRNILISKNDTNLNNLNSDKKDDLVTIVTITPQNSDNLEASENRAHHEGGIVGTESREQIEILAHL